MNLNQLPNSHSDDLGALQMPSKDVPGRQNNPTQAQSQWEPPFTRLSPGQAMLQLPCISADPNPRDGGHYYLLIQEETEAEKVKPDTERQRLLGPYSSPFQTVSHAKGSDRQLDLCDPRHVTSPL